jgi:hypothetical protein
MVVKVQVTDPSKSNPRKIPAAIFIVLFLKIRKKLKILLFNTQLKALWKA